MKGPALDTIDAGNGRIAMVAAATLTRPGAPSTTRAVLRMLQQEFAATMLVTLVQARECDALGLTNLAADTAATDMQWLHAPIVDGSVPADLDAWLGCLQAVRAELQTGATVVAHCRAGLGRTGMFAACVLATYGASDAIARVRRARPGAVETPAQGEYVEATRTAWSQRTRGLT